MYQLEITFWFTCQILLVLAPSGGRIFKNWIRHSLDQNWDGSLVLTFDKVPLSIDFRNVLILVGHIKCNISFKVKGPLKVSCQSCCGKVKFNLQGSSNSLLDHYMMRLYLFTAFNNIYIGPSTSNWNFGEFLDMIFQNINNKSL